MLTDAKIRASKPREKAYKLPDGQGLFLHVTPAGGRHWRLRYVMAGKEKTLTIGPYPAFSLLDARTERDRAKALLRDGRSPGVEKKLRRVSRLTSEARTFETVARTWHARNKPQWTDRHQADVLHSLERDVFGSLGAIPLAQIAPPMVLTVLQDIEARNAIETAHRVRQRISAVFVSAIAQGVATFDPAAIVASELAPVVRGRQPSVTDLVEAREMLRRVETAWAHPVTTLAMRLLALTGLRPGELRQGEWSEFSGLDTDQPLWTVPQDRMKMRKEHLVPLSAQAVDLLRVLEPFTGRGRYLFPNVRRPRVCMSENALGYLLNRAGYHGRHVPHGWRSTFSTAMNERYRSDRAVIDVMLAHVPKDRVESAYNRALYLDRRRELAQAWADLLLEGSEALEGVVVKARR